MSPLDPALEADLAAWLVRYDAVLPEPGSDSLGGDERELILDVARIAAHRGVRAAAPVATYLAGMAAAGLPADERVARLRALVAALEAG
jgi:hypothetical protein